MTKLVDKGLEESLAAAALMFGSFIGILLPIILIVIMLTSKIGKAVANSERLLMLLRNKLISMKRP
jgi:hypothetical protein